LVKVRSWLQLFRAHTAPATILLVMTCYLVGGGSLFSVLGLLVGLFALLVHWLAFGHNSLMDTQAGWDLKDPHKQHHPLVTGVISLESAHKVIHLGIMALAIYGISLAYFLGGNFGWAMAFFALFIVGGYSYNCGLDKVLLPSFIPITICWTALGLYAYYIVASGTSWLIVLVALYIAFAIWFQISWEGNLKEIEVKEANLLKWMGAKCDGKTFDPSNAKYYGWAVKLANLGVGMAIWGIFLPSLLTLIPVSILTGLALIVAHLLIRPKKWERNNVLVLCAVEEILTIYLILTVLIPVIGLGESVFLMVFGIAYFVCLNKAIWGTILRPQV